MIIYPETSGARSREQLFTSKVVISRDPFAVPALKMQRRIAVIIVYFIVNKVRRYNYTAKYAFHHLKANK